MKGEDAAYAEFFVMAPLPLRSALRVFVITELMIQRKARARETRRKSR